MKVRIELEEEMLGMSCANADVHKEYIASRSADAKKIEEELESLPAQDLIDKALTVFPRMEDGTPFVWDYQLRGAFKEWLGIQVELLDKEVKVGKSKLSKYTYKRIVDNYVFVNPRKVRLVLPAGGGVGVCTRPLRCSTMQGDRVALASSETVPAGTVLEFELVALFPGLNDLLKICLDYGRLKGLGQWRNSGKGRFKWDEVE
jgi:hypothetical protein